MVERGDLSKSDVVDVCEHCNYVFPLDRLNCPCCGRPQRFPNVKLASTEAEQNKLKAAYENALKDADTRQCRAQVDAFDELCKKSQVIFRCEVEMLHRHIASGTDIYAPYHALESLRLRVEGASTLDFAKLRPMAETELFGSAKYNGQIHYACLSCDGMGLPSYGNCVVRPREAMIAHRSSCFDGNSAVVFAAHRTFSSRLRSDWERRHQICTAVFAHDIDSRTESDQYASILVQPGDSALDDAFVEVHIFGDMVAATFESITFLASGFSHVQQVYQEAIIEKLQQAGVNYRSRGGENDG